MKRHSAFLAALICSGLMPSVAQQWQLVTPIKTRSELIRVRMTDALTGFTIDRPMGAILKTSNAGVDWERKVNNLGSASPKALWMWDSERGIVAANSGRFYRTDDGFTTISTTVTTFGHMNALFFVNDLIGFAGTEDGKILRTDDGGVSWVAQVSGVTSMVYCFYFLNDQLGFASAGAHLLRTTDGGATWEDLPTPELVNVRDMHFFDAQHGIGVGSVGLIIRTDDGGDSWTVMPSPTTYNLYDLDVQGNMLVACGAWGHVIRSVDGGDTWAELTTDGHERFAVSFSTAGIGLMTGSSGYIYRSLDMGATWGVVYRGIPHTGLNKVSFANDTIGVTVGVSGSGGLDAGFMRTIDGGRHWNGSIGGGLGIHLRPDGAGAAGASHTADFFETSQAGITTPAVAIRCVRAFSPSNYIVAGGNLNGGFYRTTNSGATWAYTAAGNPYDIYFPTETMGYAAGEGNNVYKTVDAGVTWTDLGPVVPSEQFTVFFLDELRGWTGGAGAGARTIDGGVTWETMGSIPSYTKSIFFTDADTGYAVGQTGQTVRSVDGGVTWNNFVGEIFNATIGDAALVDGALIAVGNAGDIYRAQLRCPLHPLSPAVLEVDGELCTTQASAIQWYLNEEAIPGATAPCFNPASTGNYNAVITDALGCVSAPSDPVHIISTFLPGRSRANGISLYPDPVEDLLQISTPEGSIGGVEIIDAQGRVVKRLFCMSARCSADMSDLKSGLYMVRCGLNGCSIAQRFMKY